jgi:hypothetical protein
MMKKVEVADTASNFFVLCAVLVAAIPFLLGDQLAPMASSAMREGTLMLNELNTFFVKLLS